MKKDQEIDGKYSILSLIGKGGMGEVFRAVDLRDGGEVALKMLTEEERETSGSADLRREFGILAALRHPNIVHVLDSGTSPPYYTMELIEGENLVEFFSGKPLLPVLYDILQQILRGLEFIHSRKLLHGDLKPANILVLDDPENPRVKLMDFGLARKWSEIGRSSVPAGTALYISPEMIQPRRRVTPDRRADFYSLGAVLYELTAGEPPFPYEKSDKLVRAHLSEEPAPIGRRRPDLPRAFTDLVMRLLEKDPADRFASCTDILDKLSISAGRPLTLEDRKSRESYILNSRFIGRAAEMAQLTGWLDKSFSGVPDNQDVLRDQSPRSPVLALVGGETGVGKTRLLDEISGFCRDSGIICFRAECEEQSGHSLLGFRPFILNELIPLLLRRRSGLPERYKDVLGLPGFSEGQGTSVGDSSHTGEIDHRQIETAGDKYSWMERFTGFVLEALKELDVKTAVIIFEDIHWGTSISFELLQYLIRKIGLIGVPVRCMASFRTEDISMREGLSRFLEEEERGDYSFRLDIPRLDIESTTRIIESMLGLDRLPRGLADFTFRESSGNPLLIVQILILLVDESFLVKGDRWWRWTPPETPGSVLPGSIKELALRRIAGLQDNTRTLLENAAVLGRGFDPEILGEMSGLESNDLYRALEECFSAGLVERRHGTGESGFRMVHGMFRDAVYEEISPDRLRILHRKAGEILSKRNADSEDAGIHFYKAGMLEEAIPHLEKLAIRENAAFNFSASADALEKVLAATIEPRRQAIVSAKLASVYYTLGDIHRCEFLLREAAAILSGNAPDPTATALSDLPYKRPEELRRFADILDGLGNVSATAKDFATARRFHMRALEIRRSIWNEAGVAASYLNLGALSQESGYYSDAEEYLEKCVELARNLKDDRLLPLAYNNLGSIFFDRGEQEKAQEYYLKTIKLAEAKNDIPAITISLLNLGESYLEAGRFGDALHSLERSLELSVRLGHRFYEGQAHGVFGRIMEALGRLDEAGEHYRRSLEIARETGDKYSLTTAFFLMGRYYVNIDRLPLAILYFTRSLKLRQRLGDTRGENECRVQLGAVNFFIGRNAIAGRILSEALELSASLKRWREEAAAAFYLAATLLRLSRMDRALSLFERSREAAGRAGYKRGEIQAAAYESFLRLELGQLTDVEPLESLLQEARSIGARKLFGETSLLLGRALAARHEFRTAVMVLEEGLVSVRDASDRYQEGEILRELAVVACEQGKFNRGYKLFDDSLSILRKLSMKFETAKTLEQMGRYLTLYGLEEEGERRKLEAASLLVEIESADEWKIFDS